MSRFTEEQIRVACDWWIANLGGPTRIVGKGASKKERETETVAALALTLRRSQEAPREETIQRFRETLAQVLREEPVEWLSVDYGPDRTLRLAADMAKLPHSWLPWKTSMWLDLDDGSVKVRYGYDCGRTDCELNGKHIHQHRRCRMCNEYWVEVFCRAPEESDGL